MNEPDHQLWTPHPGWVAEHLCIVLIATISIYAGMLVYDGLRAQLGMPILDSDWYMRAWQAATAYFTVTVVGEWLIEAQRREP